MNCYTQVFVCSTVFYNLGVNSKSMTFFPITFGESDTFCFCIINIYIPFLRVFVELIEHILKPFLCCGYHNEVISIDHGTKFVFIIKVYWGCIHRVKFTKKVIRGSPCLIPLLYSKKFASLLSTFTVLNYFTANDG